MVRDGRKRTPALPIRPVFPDDVPDDFVPEDGRLAAFLEEHGESADGVVRVYREGPGGYKDQILEQTYSLSEFEPGALLKPPFNGGKFRIYVTIDKKTQHFPLRVASRPAVETAAAPDASMVLAPVLAAMLEGFKQLGAQVANATAARASGMGVEETIRLMQTLNGFAGARAMPAQDPIAMVREVLSLQKLVTPDRAALPEGEVDSGTIILRAMEIFGKPLADAMAQYNEEQAAMRGGVRRPGARSPALVVDNTAAQPAAQTVPTTPAVDSNPEETQMNLKIAMVRPILIGVARSGADVEPYVDVMLDTFTAEELDKYINAADWKEQLLKTIPEAADVMPWFEKLRARVLEVVKETPHVDGAPPAV